MKIFDSFERGSFRDESRPLPPMVRCPSTRHLFLGTDTLQVRDES